MLLRLGAGVMLGSVRDERSGRFTAETGETVKAHPVADTGFATYLYVDPVARVSTQVADQIEVGAELQALLLIALSQPRFDNRLELGAPGPSLGTYPDDTLTGRVVLVLAPGVSARYVF